MGIGKRIKEARCRLNLTQDQLGEMVGVTGSSIANYETEVSHPKEEVMYKLISALQVDANYLFQDVVKLPLKDKNVTLKEFDHIKKYRKLDEHGRDLVDTIIDKEMDRIKKSDEDYLTPMAAHNDKGEDPEEQKLITKAAGEIIRKHKK